MQAPAPPAHSVEDICNVFWDIESRYDLLSYQPDNVPLWPLIRFKLYYKIVQETGVFDNPHPFVKPQSIKDKGLFYLSVIKDMIFRNPLLSLGHHGAENCILPHPRMKNGQDIYTKKIMQAIPKANRVIFFDRIHDDAQHLEYYNQWIAIKRRLCRIRNNHPPTLSDDTLALMDKVAQDFKKHFDVTFDIGAMVTKSVESYQKKKNLYMRFFQKHNFKRLYIVVAYEHPAIVAAAKACNIQVIECQHGTITRYHLGYSYPDCKDDIVTMPHTLLTFGQFWGETTPLPKTVKTQIIGAPHVNALKDKLSDNRKLINQIIVTSQGAIGKYLFPFAVEAARLNPDYDFIYRLHPSESKEHYQNIINTMDNYPNNLKLSAKSPDIFSLLAESQYQLGVFSTTLLEALPLGCKAICVDFPGVEYMRPVIERGDAICIKHPNELAQALVEAKLPEDPTYYYSENA